MKKIAFLLLIMIGSVASLGLVANSGVAYAASGGSCPNKFFLTAPAWYNDVIKDDGNGGCAPSVDKAGGLSKFIWTIAFNIVQDMLNIVAYAAVGYIIYGGFKYMTSAGSEQGTSGAKKTIMNAVIGLIISIMAIGIVNLVTKNL